MFSQRIEINSFEPHKRQIHTSVHPRGLSLPLVNSPGPQDEIHGFRSPIEASMVTTQNYSKFVTSMTIFAVLWPDLHSDEDMKNTLFLTILMLV